MDKNAQIKEYYDTFAEVYDTKHGVALHGQAYNFARHYEPFLDRAVPKGGRALELGCGTGVYTRWLTQRGFEVVAMDISAAMIEEARKKCPDAAFFEGNCEDPISAIGAETVGDGFDLVIGINTFSYYPNKRAALANYAALLKPGGRFVIIDMNGSSFFYRLMSWMNKNEMRQWLPEISEVNKADLTRMLLDAGLGIEIVERFAFIPNGLSKGKVDLLAPFDTVLGALPPFGPLAMRIACSAVKAG